MDQFLLRVVIHFEYYGEYHFAFHELPIYLYILAATGKLAGNFEQNQCDQQLSRYKRVEEELLCLPSIFVQLR